MKLLKDNLLVKLLCLHIGTRGRKSKPTICHFTKRGQILGDFVEDRDKRKKWHFQILQNNIKSKHVFEKMSRPHRRQRVLNSVFIRNISEVIANGEIAPEIIGFGIEITGIKVSPCCRLINVYWQLPSSSFAKSEEIAEKLNRCAPKIRAELISQNVLGRVPCIFFIRDSTNTYVAAFENAMKEIDLGPEPERAIIADDVFISKKKNIYKFTDNKGNKNPEDKEKIAEAANKYDPLSPPDMPPDMKYDVCGINHKELMSKVMALKSKHKPIEKSHVISASCNEDQDLFSKIPGGTTIYAEDDREQILKQFRVERKQKMERAKPKLTDVHEYLYNNPDTYVEDSEPDFDDDYIEEDTPERI